MTIIPPFKNVLHTLLRKIILLLWIKGSLIFHNLELISIVLPHCSGSQTRSTRRLQQGTPHCLRYHSYLVVVRHIPCPSQAAWALPAAMSGERKSYFKGFSAAHERSGRLTQAKRKIVRLAVMFGYDDEIIHGNAGLTERKSGFNSPRAG